MIDDVADIGTVSAEQRRIQHQREALYNIVFISVPPPPPQQIAI